MNDVPSVTQTSKQVNQKHKQNDEENKKLHYIHHQKNISNKIITQKIIIYNTRQKSINIQR